MPETRSDYLEIHDEIQTIIELLQDKTRNHKLDELIKTFQIAKLRPQDVGEYPKVVVVPLGYSSITFGDIEDQDGSLGDTYEEGVVIDLVMEEHQDIQYNNLLYKGAENGLYVLRDIVVAIFAENQRYEDPKDSSITWSNVELVGMDWLLNYDGNADAFAMSLMFQFTMQKSRGVPE